jgi:hypothetical protein
MQKQVASTSGLPPGAAREFSQRLRRLNFAFRQETINDIPAGKCWNKAGGPETVNDDKTKAACYS